MHLEVVPRLIALPVRLEPNERLLELDCLPLLTHNKKGCEIPLKKKPCMHPWESGLQGNCDAARV